MKKLLGTLLGVTVLSVGMHAVPREAAACGGCFSPPPPVTAPERATVVTDHRMVFALSQAQTTLWDQFTYAGRPEDFVWVLPVADAGALRVGLADQAFMDAMDSFTAPIVSSTLPPCWASVPRVLGADSGMGFFTGCGAAGNTGLSAMPGSDSTRVGADGQAVVGPYAITVIGSHMGGERLDSWLTQNGFHVPADTQRAIDYYAGLEFDFLILRLRPGAGVQQMQPIRVTTRGYSPVLPLRMIAAGVADNVGLTLMVVADTRMEAQGYRNVELAEEDLTYDFATRRSNWRELYAQTVGRGAGRTWVIESAQNLLQSQLNYGASAPMNPPRMTPMDGGPLFEFDALSPTFDGASPLLEAGASMNDDGGMTFLTDGAREGGMTVLPPEGGWAPAEAYVDRRYAFTGLTGPAVVTRMRTTFPKDALDRDLQLNASREGLRPAAYGATLLNGPVCPAGSSRTCSVVGVGTPAVFEGAFLALLLARLRRRRRQE